jgi:hypothetical protein
LITVIRGFDVIAAFELADNWEWLGLSRDKSLKRRSDHIYKWEVELLFIVTGLNAGA